jgi:hypothetical protein
MATRMQHRKAKSLISNDGTEQSESAVLPLNYSPRFKASALEVRTVANFTVCVHNGDGRGRPAAFMLTVSPSHVEIDHDGNMIGGAFPASRFLQHSCGPRISRERRVAPDMV